MKFNITHALNVIRPNCQYTIRGEDIYKNLEWNDSESEKPTEAEINAKITELQADYDAKKYQRDRAVSYPSIQEQLDMQYWDAVNGTNKWQEAVAKVKTDNPKPE